MMLSAAAFAMGVKPKRAREAMEKRNDMVEGKRWLKKTGQVLL